MNQSVRNPLRRSTADWPARGLRALVVCLVAMTVSGCASLRNRNPIDEDVIIARQLSQQGIDAQADGDWTIAEQRFRSAIKYSPKDQTARVQYAECLWRRGATDEATQELARAIKLSGGSDVDSIARLGEMLREMGNLPAAEQLVEQGLAENPKNSKVWKLRAVMLEGESRFDDALAAYHRALVYSPNDIEMLSATARIHYQANRPQRTVAVVERIIQQRPQEQMSPDVLHLHGRALAQLKRYDDAVQSFSMAVAATREPTATLLADLAEAQMADHRIDDAVGSIGKGFRVATSQERIRLEKLHDSVMAKQRENQLVR